MDSEENKLFNKDSNKILIVHNGFVIRCPPVINLMDCLLTNGYRVFLISEDIDKLDGSITSHPLFDKEEIVYEFKAGLISGAKRVLAKRKLYRDAFVRHMNEGDIIWTTNDHAVAALNKLLQPYQDRHVLQLMELVDEVPPFKGVPFGSFPIDEYGRKAWKTVVPERNRAYIQKVMWKLERTPYVLPNKPYRLDTGPVTDQVREALEVIKQEKRHIVLYLGIVGKDRDLTCFAEAIEQLGPDYCFYVVGRVASELQGQFDALLREHASVTYLGFFDPPSHLKFVSYADVAILPYRPVYGIKNQSPLNALYCAPNKIFEYAGFGVPMVGTDVLGLREPFEKYGIGVCCDEASKESIAEAIGYVAEHHDEMSCNCKAFYVDTDLDKIVLDIINEA